MARLVVMTTPELVAGYRLAGATVIATANGSAAEEALWQLLDDRDVAVVAVHAPHAQAFGPALRRRLEKLTLPVVIEIPSGEEREEEGRRARLMELLRHAIGHRIAFGSEEP